MTSARTYVIASIKIGCKTRDKRNRYLITDPLFPPCDVTVFPELNCDVSESTRDEMELPEDACDVIITPCLFSPPRDVVIRPRDVIGCPRDVIESDCASFLRGLPRTTECFRIGAGSKL